MRSACFCVTAMSVLFGVTQQARADSLDAKIRQEIKQLEAKVFDPILKPAEVDALLTRLRNDKHRAAATNELLRKGQAYQARIDAFADATRNLEVRAACAQVVLFLDRSSRRGLHARKLGHLYTTHSAALLPTYWPRFRKDPYDRCAAAMVVQADAETAWVWLAKQPARADRIRYLLLRIRELGTDDFAAKRIFDFPAARVKLLLADVFPETRRGSDQAAFRVVGNSVQGWIRIVPQSARNRAITAPWIESIYFMPQLVGMFRYESAANRDRGVMYTPAFYTAQTVYGPFRYIRRKPQLTEEQYQKWLSAFKKIAGKARLYRASRITSFRGKTRMPGLPQLQLDASLVSKVFGRSREKPWWLKHYVAASHQRYFQFAMKPDNATAPKVSGTKQPIAMLAPKTSAKRPSKPTADAPTLAVFAPRMPAGSTRQVQSAALLVGDRLSQELAATGKIRIVDRTQLDRVLFERRLNPQAKRPLISYDAIVRIEVDAARPSPVTRVSVIELSTGNRLGMLRLPWPVREANVPKMVAACRSAVKKLQPPKKGQLRLRWLGIQNEFGGERLRPLIRRMESEFEQAIANSKKITRIQHFDAANSKEESLLLMMGLSKLAGGRRFVPQSDAVVELRLKEVNARGKTFPETVIEPAFRIRKGETFRGEWTGIRGRVKDFATLPAKLWTQMTAQLKSVDSQASVRFLRELPLRRKQAAAELEASRKVDARLPAAEQAKQRLAHIDTALKLDPSYEAASIARLRALPSLLLATRKSTHPAVMETLRHLDRFGDSRDAQLAIQSVFQLVAATRIFRLRENRETELTDEDRQLVDAVKQLLERALHSNRPAIPRNTGRMMAIIVRAMRFDDVSVAQRTAWIDARLKECDGKLERMRNLKRSNYIRLRILPPLFEFHALEVQQAQVTAGQLAVEEGRFQRARRLVTDVWKELKSQKRQHPSLISRTRIMIGDMRRVLDVVDDEKLTADFSKWIARNATPSRSTRPGPKQSNRRLTWPTVNLFGKSKPPTVTAVRINEKKQPWSLSPLTTGDGRLYIVKSAGSSLIDWPAFDGTRPRRTGRIGYVRVDKTGRPVGKAVPILSGTPSRGTYWNAITWLPKLPDSQGVGIFCAREIDGRLYLGTWKNGLLVFDWKTRKWSNYAAKQGLPVSSVFSLFTVDERTLYCTGQTRSIAGRLSFVHFQFDRRTGKSRLLQRTTPDKREAGTYFEPRLNGMWRDGERWTAWGRSGYYTDLLGKTPGYKVPTATHPNGWKTAAPSADSNPIAFVDNRRFLLSTNALHELKADGRIRKSWWKSLRPLRTNREFVVPATAPIAGQHLIACGSLLVFYDRMTSRLRLFDPEKNLWYGPTTVVRDKVYTVSPRYILGGKAGIWLGTDYGVLFVSRDDLIAAATKAGRAVKTSDYIKRRDAFIEASSPLDRAKFAVLHRQFSQAKRQLVPLLKDVKLRLEAGKLLRFALQLERDLKTR